MNPLLKKAVPGLALLLGANVAVAECGTVQIAAMNWASAQLMASVDKIILEEGYGCNVELVPGDTMPTFTSLNEKGEPDIAPELWINAVREPLKIALEEGRLQSANDGPISGLGEGWWVPPYVLEKHPDLKTVLDVLERPDLFPDAEDPSKGAFVGCPAGWGCQLTNANLFRGFKMAEKGWKLVDPGSAAGPGRLHEQGGQPWRKLVRLLLVTDCIDRPTQDGQAGFWRAVRRQRTLGRLHRQAGTGLRRSATVLVDEVGGAYRGHQRFRRERRQ